MSKVKMVGTPSYTMEEAAKIFRDRADMNEMLLDRISFAKTKKEAEAKEITKVIDELRALAKDPDGPVVTEKHNENVRLKPTHDDFIAAQLLAYTVMKEMGGK